MPTIDDLFPPTPREVYERAPLVQVACELRFPPILRIEQPPVEFQEAIRHRFPLFEKGAPIQLPQGQSLPPEMLQLLSGQMGVGTTYQFLTEDRTSTVNLTPNLLSLSVSKYTTWNNFTDELRHPLDGLKEHYRPAFFSRVGLRYIDAVNREELGLADRAWADLLRVEVLGELAFPAFESYVQSVGHQIVLKLPDASGSVALRFGYGHVQGKSGLSYMLDFDFFQQEKTEVGNAGTILAHFNQLAGRAFRRCIRDTLRDALRSTRG